MVNARRKGASGEREFCEIWESHTGIELQRNWTQAYGGGKNNPDVKGWDPVHFEVKNQKSVCFFQWLRQVLQDARGRIPVIAYRVPANKNVVRKADWWLFIRVSDVVSFARELMEGVK